MSLIRTWSLCALLLCSAGAVAAPLDSRALDAVPLHVLPADALKRAAESLPPPSPRSPLRVGINTPLVLDLADGTWTEDGDVDVWRLRVNSPDATHLSAHFDRFVLPPSGELRIADIDGRITQGPYTAQEHGARGQLWTAMVPGESALIELRVARSERDQVDLRLADVGHGITGERADVVQAKSGGCNIDVACAQGNGWRDQIRSAVRLVIGATSEACSGVLVNNTAQNNRPLVLTAHHCGITTANDDSVTVYFNYQTSSCGGDPNGSLTQNQTGTTRLFTHARSDHTLIELNAAPRSAFNAYLSGFDASPGVLPQSGRGIHHPNADEKRISVYDSAGPYRTINLEGVTVDSIEVNWAQGVTEPGSSGSGLWNQNQRVVGVLSGGASTCGVLPTLLNPGTPAANGPDYYGRLDLAWDAGLSSHLSPNGGGRSVAGKELGSTPGSGTGGGGSGGGGSTSSGGGGGSFGAALALLFAGLVRLATARRAGSRHVTD